MNNVASAVFDSQNEAQRAISALREAGVSDNSLSVIARHGDQLDRGHDDVDVHDDDHTNLLRGILGGGALGAGLGVAALLIPGVGPFAAVGAIAATAAPGAAAVGAAAGAAAGTLNESLKDHGVSDDNAGYYADRVKQGGVFVSVDNDSGIDQAAAQEILYRHGGHNSERTSGMTGATGTTGMRDDLGEVRDFDNDDRASNRVTDTTRT